MNASLSPSLKVYVEYRACCHAGLAPGWDSDNAVQSLVLWRSWEQHLDAQRVVNVMAALPQLAKLYGSDVAKVEAAAIDVSFSALCKYGEEPCVDFNALEANETYGALSPIELVDRVIRPAMLKQEVVPRTSFSREERSGDQCGGATGSPLWLRAPRISPFAPLMNLGWWPLMPCRSSPLGP